MILRQNKPFPRTRFSPNNSGMMCLMFETFTLLINPLIDFLRASHAILWNSFDSGSLPISACKARRRAGGIYVPPDRMVSSRSYSFFAAACFSAAVSGFASSAFATFSLSSICLCRSKALDRSTSRGRCPARPGGDLEKDRGRRGGARL